MTIFTVSGACGLLLGLILVWWIGPATNPGVALIVFVSVVVCFLAGVGLSAVAGLFRKRDRHP